KGADAKAADKYGETPLHLAAKNGEFDLVKYLVEEKGADAKAADKDGNTPLHRAAKNGKLDVVKYLVEEKGADAKAVNNAGESPLHRAAENVQQVIRLQNKSKEEEILEKALKLINSDDIAKNSSSHIASVWNYASKYSKLIDEFYFNSFYDWDKKTPLHLLAKNGHSEAIKAILIHIGQNESNEMRKFIYTPTKYYDTPFKTAINNGYLDVIKVFLEK
ncbi:unnamed protein product, partial [Sphagnum jensenii]